MKCNMGKGKCVTIRVHEDINIRLENDEINM